MPNQFDGIVATTELELVNAMLSTIGEAPLDSSTDLDTPATEDVAQALQIVKRIMRSTLVKKWTFNTELQYRINPEASTFDFDDDDGETTTTVNIFLPPAGLLDFDISITADQQGTRYPDAIIRISKQYNVTTESTGSLVFYDRYNNRDGFPASGSDQRDYLLIDPVWSLDFSDLPEIARQYIMVRACRLFQKSVLGASELHAFTQDDESEAWIALKRKYGLKDELNMLDNADVSKALGFRPRGIAGAGNIRRNVLGLL
jgi:hypothetical protein